VVDTLLGCCIVVAECWVLMLWLLNVGFHLLWLRMLGCACWVAHVGLPHCAVAELLGCFIVGCALCGCFIVWLLHCVAASFLGCFIFVVLLVGLLIVALLIVVVPDCWLLHCLVLHCVVEHWVAALSGSALCG